MHVGVALPLQDTRRARSQSELARTLRHKDSRILVPVGTFFDSGIDNRARTESKKADLAVSEITHRSWTGLA